MQVNANAPDKILSLLLDIAKCSFVRVTEFKKSGHVRHQFGAQEHAVFINEDVNNGAGSLSAVDQVDPDQILDSKKASHFVEEEVIYFGDYQFNLSILNQHHAQIQCSVSCDHDPVFSNHKTSRRKAAISIAENTARVVIELVHHEALPELIIKLKTYTDNQASTLQTTTESLATQQRWLSSVLLRTMCVTIEALQLFDHYIHLSRDSLTKLRSRTALQTGIDEQFEHSSMALCMVHCIDFQHVNRKFGQERGDKVLHEIACVIEQHTRSDDISGRFGGALFGIAVNASSLQDGYTLASKLQSALHNQVYLQNAIRLTFNVGLAFVSQDEGQFDTGSTSSLLINRAEQALKAAQNSDKPAIVQWEPDKFRLDQQEFNYLGGIFTPDNVTNYRNMLLLWDISSIIADEHTFERLLKSVIERLAFTFEFAYAGIVTLTETSDKESLAQNYSFELQNATDIISIEWENHPYQSLVYNAAKLAIENSQHTESQEDGLNSLVIPLGNDTSECFFIMGHSELLDLTHDTVMLFVGFARQLGKAFKRSQLEEQLNKNLAQKNAQLSQELLELKAGMKSSALVYRSAKMQKIVEQTQRAAQTDATVLITGESGTGKEKLINAIHALSPREKKPLVIVDCGSIPEALIESELFGHVKGAFTGAQSNNIGKIQSADGGIIVLDEIGELPITMQPKLLRFVQEKRYTPLGGNKSIAVNVKIVAVTNRDLAFEVSQGRFRKDLFYRLNVVNLHNPPLRERIEDIDLLCQHFLSKFSRQFEMDKKRISQHTITLMTQYKWPGNIRELENKLLQASLLTTSDEIFYNDLNLQLPHDNHDQQAQAEQTINPQSTEPFEQLIESQLDLENRNFAQITVSNGNGSHYASELTKEISPKQWCQEFSFITAKIVASLNIHTMLNVSIGNAIELVLLNMAHKECRSHARTAILLQLPISTARRRLQKQVPNLMMFDNDTNWQALMALLDHVVNTRVQLDQPVDLIRSLIAMSILDIHRTNMAVASQLMGVSEPTMYKIRKQLQATQQ
jgi:diguanylate cyclase (GGDEF)-like protein